MNEVMTASELPALATGPKVSVVIATRGRAPLLAGALSALESQTLPCDQFEVVVWVDGPDPETVALLEHRSAGPLTLRWGQAIRSQGPAAARNEALRRCSAGVIAITDDDCLPTTGWLQAILAEFSRQPEVGVLVGRTTTERACLTPFSHYVENLEGSSHQTCNIAYRRALLDRLGGFDERFPFSHEDTDLFLRAEQVTPVRFVPAVHVVHPPRELTVEQIIRGARKFEGDFIFAQKHRNLYRDRHGGKSPLASVFWDVSVKHSLKQVLRNAGWLLKSPTMYLKFVTAQLLFTVYLWSHLPGFWWRHRSEDADPILPCDAEGGLQRDR